MISRNRVAIFPKVFEFGISMIFSAACFVASFRLEAMVWFVLRLRVTTFSPALMVLSFIPVLDDRPAAHLVQWEGCLPIDEF